MFWEFEEEFWMEMDSEFNQAEFTWTNDESFAPLPLLQTEQPKEDDIARCMCMTEISCFACFPVWKKDLRAVQ